MYKIPTLLILSAATAVAGAFAAEPVPASEPQPAAAPAETAYDAGLAQRLEADARGMRQYVLVILKTGPTRVPDGPARDAMFAGHFANIERLAKAGKLALAGPFVRSETGWRGLYVFAVEGIEEARELAESDPVVVQGEMVAEYHPWYGSAAVMLISDWHGRLVPPDP